MTTTLTTRCVGTSSTQSWSGRRPTGRCTRPVGFAVMGWGQYGGHTAPELTCQAHLGGVVAKLASQRTGRRRERREAPSITVTAVTPAGLCVSCQERPEWHEPGAPCPEVAG